VRGLFKSLIQSRERVAAGIVCHRGAREEDGRSRVEYKGAYDCEKRGQAQKGSLALADAISYYN
jgi:hypothetical protein